MAAIKANATIHAAAMSVESVSDAVRVVRAFIIIVVLIITGIALCNYTNRTAEAYVRL